MNKLIDKAIVIIMTEDCEKDDRYTVSPIKDQEVYEWYLKAKGLIWHAEHLDIELAKDKFHWPNIPKNVQKVIKTVLSFFAISDGVVNENIETAFTGRIKSRECLLWYNFQKMMEDIHNITYGKLVEQYITDVAERKNLLDALTQFPSIKAKVDWIHKNIRGDVPLSKVILINTIVEGLMFSSSFAVIFWIADTFRAEGGGMALPGLSKANEWISRDEGMHTEFGQLMYKRCKNKLPAEQVTDIIKDAVEVESMFVREAMPEKMPAMNHDLMIQYVKFVADGLLVDLGYSKYYNVVNPFSFIVKQNISVRQGDFFTDHAITEYKATLMTGVSAMDSIPDPDDEDF